MMLLFATVLALQVAIKVWLGTRQVRHVTRHAGAVPAEFAGTISLEDHRRAARYTVAKQRLALVDTVGAALVFIALTWGGLLQWLLDALRAHIAGGVTLDLAFVVVVALVLALADLPMECVRRFGVEQHFGFNRMTPAMFALDVLKSTLVAAVLGIPLLAAVLLVMRETGAYWWLGAWLLWAGFSLALAVLYPWLIAPLFNRFTPLADGALRQRVGDLLARTGFRSNGVYTMDGSRRSTHGNAYFTGMGSAKRIVFYDTLVARLAPEEIEAVLAHELGHFRLHHIRQRMLIGLGASLAWLAVLGWLRTQSWFAPSLGVAASGDGVVLVLFALAAPVFGFLLAPLQSAFSRRHEYQADDFAARHASADDLVRALVKLYQDNASTLTPDPVHSAFYDSHPPASLRIAHLRERAPHPAGS